MSQIRRVDVFRIFRSARFVVGSVVAVLVGGTVAMMAEPRDALGPRWMQVQNVGADFGATRPRDFFDVDATVILPNGTTHTYSVFAKRISDEGWLCVQVALGRWTEAYQVNVVGPETCKGLRAPRS